MKRLFSLIITIVSVMTASCSDDNSSKKDPSTPEPPIPPSGIEITPINVRDYMVDPDATDETVALFYNLKKLSKTSFAVGQQDAFNGFYKNDDSMSDVKKATGSDPALLGSDFMFITDKNNDGTPENWFHQQEEKTIAHVKQAYSLGMINIFAWHIREPYLEDVFYASEMSAANKAKAFKSILPGNENHEWYRAKLDKVASVFGELKGQGGELIPVIFRPFHEYDGNWFWWGAAYCTADEYKTIFKFTVEYLRDTKGVHNVLYSLGPDNSYDTETKYLSRYPGDDYVDVLGMDNYWDLRSGTGQDGADLANKKLKVISDMAKAKGKIAAFTETGYEITTSNSPVNGWFSTYIYHVMTANDVELAFVMFWVNGSDKYYVPTPAATNVNDFKAFTQKPEALLQNELPDMYEIEQ
jgi:mannan endo-1,4-beta-mannosidase